MKLLKHNFVSMVLILTLLLILCSCGGGDVTEQQPDAMPNSSFTSLKGDEFLDQVDQAIYFVYLNVNPEFQLYLNEDQTIIAIEAINDDAKELFGSHYAAYPISYDQGLREIFRLAHSLDMLPKGANVQGDVIGREGFTEIEIPDKIRQNVETLLNEYSEERNLALTSSLNCGIGYSGPREEVTDSSDETEFEILDPELADPEAIDPLPEEHPSDTSSSSESSSSPSNSGSSGNSGSTGIAGSSSGKQHSGPPTGTPAVTNTYHANGVVATTLETWSGGAYRETLFREDGSYNAIKEVWADGTTYTWTYYTPSEGGRVKEYDVYDPISNYRTHLTHTADGSYAEGTRGSSTKWYVWTDTSTGYTYKEIVDQGKIYTEIYYDRKTGIETERFETQHHNGTSFHEYWNSDHTICTTDHYDSSGKMFERAIYNTVTGEITSERF